MIGQTIAHYRITAKLGESVMGEAYDAAQVEVPTERLVAI